MQASKILTTLLITTCLSSCGVDTAKISSGVSKFTENLKERASPLVQTELSAAPKPAIKTLESLIATNSQVTSLRGNFRNSIAAAVMADPSVRASQRDLDAIAQRSDIAKGAKDWQLTGSLYGGVDDVSNDTKGIAAVLNASRLLYDGGKVDAQVAAAEHRARSAEFSLSVRKEEKAREFINLWIELDRYQKLSDQINSRLQILGPLIKQLERVADAGVGDVSQVAAAQRTVSAIRVTQSDVEERLQQAQVNFKNAFGAMPKTVDLEPEALYRLVPGSISNDTVAAAPALRAQYQAYLAAEADLQVVKGKDKFALSFDVRAAKPFGNSGYSSEESLGLVLRKNFFTGNQLEAEIKESSARVETAVAQLQALHREGERTVKISQQTINSMDRAISLARDNARITADEISYLRKQLVIGGSTLESVLSAEARLYDAESQEINFEADRLRAAVNILSALGLLSEAFGI